MQGSYPSGIIVFLIIGFLAAAKVHGQTCQSEYQRCKALSDALMSNPGNTEICSPGHSLRSCVNMLGMVCGSGTVGDEARALIKFIEYICSPQGMSDLAEFGQCSAFITCAITYPHEVHGLCRSAELIGECLRKDCNMQAVNFYSQLTASTIANCRASSTETPGGDGARCVQEYQRCLTLISTLGPEYDHNICSPEGQLRQCASSLVMVCSGDRQVAADSIGRLINLIEYLCSPQAQIDAAQSASCSAAACLQTFLAEGPTSTICRAYANLEECMEKDCTARAVYYVTTLIRRPQGCMEDGVTLPWPGSPGPMTESGERVTRSTAPAGPVPARSSSTTSSEKSGILQMVLLCALLMKAIGVRP